MRFEVRGTPAPKGSARAIMRGGFARLVPSSSDVNRAMQANWVAAVRRAARDVPLIAGAVWVSIVFRLERPQSHYGTGKNAHRLKPSAPTWPTTKPDIDKLARCTLDALTEVAFEDDSCIANLHVGKEYATPSQPEGALIVIGSWPMVVAQPELAIERGATA